MLLISYDFYSKIVVILIAKMGGGMNQKSFNDDKLSNLEK
jgi:hypothetical protein